MQIFDKLSIRHKIEKAGHKISAIKITDPQLKTLSDVQLNTFESKYGVSNIAIHRGDLQMILAEEIGFENIKLSKRLSKIEQGMAINSLLKTEILLMQMLLLVQMELNQ